MATVKPAVAPALILPDAPERYNVDDQRQMRRLLKEAHSTTVDFGALVTVPTPVKALSVLTGAANMISYWTSATAMALTSLTAYARSLLGAASATAARVTLDIVEHQSSVTQTTGSLADQATETGTLTIPDLLCKLVSLVTDRACWVTLYTTAAARTADAARAITTLPTAGTGVLCDFVASGAQTIPCSPVPTLANGDGAGGIASAPTVYYRIKNLSGAAHTVAATFHFAALP